MSSLPLSFEPATWSRVRRFLSRRVPREMLDDVAQSVACETWASRDRAETPGFVYGVARNEAFDARRRAARVHEPLEADATPVGHVAEASFAHAELAEVIDYVEKTPRLAQPMRWLVAEHAGDSFEEIGAREGIAPATVRKRVSRLRKELRAVFAAAALVVAALATREAIHAATPELITNEAGAAVLPIADGRWKIESIASPEPAAQAARGAVIQIHGAHGAITIAGATTAFTVERDHGAYYVRAFDHREAIAVSKLSEDRAVISLHGASITIARIR